MYGLEVWETIKNYCGINILVSADAWSFGVGICAEREQVGPVHVLVKKAKALFQNTTVWVGSWCSTPVCSAVTPTNTASS